MILLRKLNFIQNYFLVNHPGVWVLRLPALLIFFVVSLIIYTVLPGFLGAIFGGYDRFVIFFIFSMGHIAAALYWAHLQYRQRDSYMFYNGYKNGFIIWVYYLGLMLLISPAFYLAEQLDSYYGAHTKVGINSMGYTVFYFLILTLAILLRLSHFHSVASLAMGILVAVAVFVVNLLFAAFLEVIGWNVNAEFVASMFFFNFFVSSVLVFVASRQKYTTKLFSFNFIVWSVALPNTIWLAVLPSDPRDSQIEVALYAGIWLYLVVCLFMHPVIRRYHSLPVQS